MPKGTTSGMQTIEGPNEAAAPPEILGMMFDASDIDFKADGATADETKVTLPDSKGSASDSPPPKKDETKPFDVKDTSKDSKESKDGQEVKDDKGKEVRPGDDKKEEPKSIIKPPGEKKEKKEEGKQPEVKQIVPPEKKEHVRDYTGYSPEEQTIFKQMSHEAFAYTTKLIKENKALAGGSYLQHDQGYFLDPGYQTMQRDVFFANKEIEAWRKVILACEAGQPFKELKGQDSNTGEIVYGNEVKPTDETKLQIQESLNNVLGIRQQMVGRMQQFAQTHKARISQDAAAIEQERKARFAWAADPKYLDYTMDFGGKTGERSIKDIRQDILNLFPPYFRNMAPTQVAADIFVALCMSQLESKQYQSQASVAEIKRKEVAKTEPSSDSVDVRTPKDKGKFGVAEFSMEGAPSI